MHRRSFAAWTVIPVALAVVLAGCRPGGGPGPHPSPPVAVKPQLAGLVDMGVQTAYRVGTPFGRVNLAELGSAADAFSGVVVNETWAQLEPSAGHEDWSDLDASLAAVAAYDSAHPTARLAVKLRIFGGRTAPGWATSLGGPPLTVPTSTASLVLGRWWTPAYRAAWSAFQHALAAREDGNPLVRAVAVTSCATTTGEPFITPGGPRALSVLAAAGWTAAAQQQCLSGALGDYSGWKRTWVDYPFNVFHGGTGGPDPAFTEQVMAACARSAAAGGPHCVLGNHGLRESLPGGASPVYDDVDTLWSQTPGHAAVYFQTYGPQDGTCASIALAVAHHATSVELWPPQGRIPGFSATPAATLRAWNGDLTAGRAPTC